MNGEGVPSAGVTCPSCGSAAVPGDRFCGACGAPLPPPASGPAPGRPPTGRPQRRVGIYAAVVVAVLIAAVAGFVALRGDDDDASPTTTGASTSPTAFTTSTTTATTTATTTTAAEEEPADEEPAGFATPEEALAWFFADADPPHAGLCDDLAGREVELGGTVMCARLVEDRSDTRIYMEGVFATDDLRYWVLVGSGSAGWNIADWSEGEEQPAW